MFRFALVLPLLLASCSDQTDPGEQVPVGTDASAPAGLETELSPAPPAGPASGPISRYTSFKDCRVVELRADEDWSVSRCAGPGGYSLMVDYGDARDDLRLVRKGGKPVALGLVRLGSGGFNALGDAAEWRGLAAGGAFVPTALIVRNNATDNPERPEQPTAFLVVIDLAQSCVVGQVRPMAGQNEQARKLADGPKLPCLKGRE